MLPPDLVAAIDAAAPDDPGPRLVAADWLQQRGDPHGELIALAIDGRPETAARVRELQERLASLPPTCWRWGFVERVVMPGRRLGDDAAVRPDRLAALLASSVTSTLRSLRIEDVTTDEIPLLASVLAGLPSTVRDLHLARPDHGQPPSATDLSSLWARVPRLEKLVLRLDCPIGALALPALVELDVVRASPGDLAAARLPRLAALRIDSIRDDITRLEPITADRFPALERLAIAIYDTPAEALLALPISHRLRSIEIISGPASERDRRRFPLDRDGEVRSRIAGLVDLGCHPDGCPGRYYPFDPDGDVHLPEKLGRATMIEYTGADWWLRDGLGSTRLNGSAMSHVRLRAGDILEVRDQAFRLVGDEAELAQIRARTNLY